MRVYRPERPLALRLGDVTVDLTTRAMVMGILNRTKDSFFPPAATFDLDDLYARADQLVREGADLLDIGGVKAAPGDEVSESEELDRVAPVIAQLVRRFDVPISVDTWRASVAKAAFIEGACIGNDISGFADPEYLAVAAEHHAAVVATHIRLRPRVADPHPTYGDVTETVKEFLLERVRRATSAGVEPQRIILDAGLDLGKTAGHSVQLLRDSDVLASLGLPLLLSASNKTFLGVLFDLPVTARREASLGATALGIAAGCRIVRVHDVQGAVRVRDAIDQLLRVAP